MRIETTGSDLRAAAGWAAQIVPGKPVLPVLGGVLLDASGDTATISATDMERFGVAGLTGAVLESGRSVVSARLLSQIAHLLKPNAEVTLSRQGARIELTVGRSKWGLPELDLANWPVFPDQGEAIGSIAAPDLRRGLARVLPAVSTDTVSRPELMAVAFAPGPESLTLVATDRYRIAVAELYRWQAKAEIGELIVPAGILKPTLDALRSSAGDVLVSSDNGTITLECGADRITGRLGDKFVKWAGVMPDPAQLTSTIVLAEVEALRTAIGGAALVCKDLEPVELAFSADGVRVSPPAGRNESDDDASTHADLLAFDGVPITVAVTPAYALDALTGIDEPVVEIRFGDNPARPILLWPAWPNAQDDYLAQTDYRHVLVPRAGVAR